MSICPSFYGQYYNLIIIYYSHILYRVKIHHVKQAKNRYVSHLEIHHMVYTDTGESTLNIFEESILIVYHFSMQGHTCVALMGARICSQ